MVTPKNGRPRGRPPGTKKDVRGDPDRIAIAYAWRLQSLEGISENRSYTQAALFYALPVTLIVDPSTRAVSFQPEDAPGLPADREGGTVDRLRKKGARWRLDPAARSYIETLMATIDDIMARHQSADSREFLPLVWRDLRALVAR